MKIPLVRLLSLSLSLVTLPAFADIAMDTDFPGGSGEVVSIDQATSAIVLNPADHPGRGWRCWWYVKLTGLTPGKTITLDVGDAPWATPKQATFSTDDGKTWQHSGPGVVSGKRTQYSFKFETDSALVAWGPPFVAGDAKSMLEKIATTSPDASAFSLCKTREDRETPAIRIGTAGKPLVWVQARQHAWESGSSWVGKGFVEWLVSDAPGAAKLRKHHEIVFVPIMDVDNVQRGAGGKGQSPQDHNRDWSDAPHWKAVAAAQKEIRAAATAGRLAMFIDLHNPGPTDMHPCFFVPPSDLLTEVNRSDRSRFFEIVKKEMTGPLRFSGCIVETGAKYDAKAWETISCNWVTLLGTSAVSVTLETSWNTPASTTEGYQTVGRQLGLAIAEYLQPDREEE